MERNIIFVWVERLSFIFGEKALDFGQHDHEFDSSNFHKMFSQLINECFFQHLKMLSTYHQDNMRKFICK